MTDNEIIKADNEIIKSMQCVIGNGVNCSECAYQKTLPFPSCTRMCAKNALDLINRQKAKIESLEKELMKCKLEKELLYNVSVEKQNIAIKEFEKRLKEKLQWDVEFDNKLVFESDIDNIVKEMTS